MQRNGEPMSVARQFKLPDFQETLEFENGRLVCSVGLVWGGPVVVVPRNVADAELLEAWVRTSDTHSTIGH